MNTELQKTICEQLPYGLIVSHPTEDRTFILTFENHDTLVESLGCKSILRRMDLTKPITHKGYNDGKEFAPVAQW